VELVGGNHRERASCVLRSTVDGAVTDGVPERSEQRTLRIRGWRARAHRRNLCDDRRYPLVDTPDDEHLSGAVAVTPDGDGVAVDRRHGLDVGHRVAVPTDLYPGVDLLAALATAVTEVAVVVEKHGEPGLSEHLGVFGRPSS
jgi:hypothetical protein